MENLAKLLSFGPCTRSLLNGSTSCTMASMSTILNFVFLCGGSHWHYASRLTGFTIQDMAATMSSRLNVLTTNRVHYSRSGSYYVKSLECLNDTHPGAKIEMETVGLSVRRNNLSIGQAIDLAGEQSYMKNAIMAGKFVKKV